MQPSVAESPSKRGECAIPRVDYPDTRLASKPGVIAENARIEAQIVADEAAAALSELIAETHKDVDGAMRVVKARMEKRLEEIRARLRARADELPAQARVA
jgi:ElaB/YqjD/DUF883 family membrane-anchored ribosome-binding protein